MQPLKPSEKQSILENQPNAQPADVEEYERLLSRRFATDPDFAPAEAPTAEAMITKGSFEQSEDRIAELHTKLYGGRTSALEQLQQKYAPVIQTIEGFSDEGAKLENVSLDGEKLYLKVSVPSQVIANRVWDVIKQVDPTHPDLHDEIATIGGPDQSYSVKIGDNLSKISSRFYGSPNHDSNIAKASNISDPKKKIRAGQEITIPKLPSGESS
jgi:nucleoid-associated protein YgaU